MKKRGIYKIINLINGKVYIGESLDIYRRWDTHKEDLNSNKHHSYKLQKDWNEYGQDNFKFEVISLLSDEIKRLSDEYILLIYEDYYIKHYDSINNGYNIENTLEKILLGEKKTSINKNDIYNLSIYQKQIEDKKILNDHGVIYNPKYFGMKDLSDKLNIRRISTVLMYSDLVQRTKTNKHKYELSDKYKDRKDIFLNNEAIDKIRFTEQGLEFAYNLLKETN